ncbi:FAD-binding protein [Couchioplanes caeruleus]|uniref:23S rRNA methyltransferase n=2 Tax=Couchioplanes caeruleus TaxID=56438 RepID=A0A1K0FPK8_9ACTN|nr:FAD-binding protein [Couchioplanes caeruleus]OJF14781.1 23S rRNA methyltransferase [Couchioplanes caeruleus subsp. caeruleus]ROP28066.1 3-oxo-5alpha-steroid 4-dehydrogenase [Couchioplanes caeruleus]
MTEAWHEAADVVVVGFGAAGACAAVEAAEAGARVLVLDRFTGGGATAISGGVVYAGGGTRQQTQAGVTDTPQAMAGYLREEVGDAVSAATLRRFCAQSAGMLAWLEERGVPFDASLCPHKTSYPTDRYFLYHSGSELSFAHVAPPAPRGHRAHARGASGRLLHARLAVAARSAGAEVRVQTRAHRLVTAGGRVVGVECHSLRDAPAWARLGHRVLHRWSVKPGIYLPALGRALHRPVAWLERRYARSVRIGARLGVVLAAGGFVFDREMLREHAPDYRGGLRLGTVGDDGSGIRLGTGIGAATGHLDRISIWRFLTPPSALVGGLLVDRDGRRVCDESRYGAAIGEAVLRCPERRAWLLIDAALLAEARRGLRGQSSWFQWLQARWLLGVDRVTGPSLERVARRAGVDPAGLAATVEEYHAGRGDPAGKPAELVRPLRRAPYSLIDVSIRPRMFVPAPMLTLGGLRVDEETGRVLRPDGSGVPGLFAAGRTAVGICSRSYVSGLSLADCVFSGRRAGRSATAEDRGGVHAHRD